MKLKVEDRVKQSIPLNMFIPDIVDGHYSGEQSKEFWERVWWLKDPAFSVVYSAGVILQEIESRVLTWLINAENRKQFRKYNPFVKSLNPHATKVKKLARRKKWMTGRHLSESG